MADPLSITSSAAGVVSLGLTVCQGLISYYGPWSAYNMEISCVAQKAEGLGTTLTMLQKSVQHFGSSAGEVPIEVQRRLLACVELLESLESAIERCKKTSPPSDFQDKAQALRRRMMYPFRRDTLQWLVNSVEGLQSNLNTAIQVLQIVAMASQTEQLNLLLSASMSTTASSKAICERVSHLSSEMAIVGNILPTMQENIPRVALVLDKHEERLRNMELMIERSPQRLDWKPTLPSSLCEEHQRLKTTMHHEIQTSYPLKTAIGGNSVKMILFTSDCSCTQSPYVRRTWYTPRNFSFFRFSTTSHQKTCPLYKIAKQIETLGFRYSFRSRFLSTSIRATLSVTTGAGGLSINPQMSIFNVVPHGAPAFELLHPYHLCTLRERDAPSYMNNLCGFLNTTFHRLCNLFRDGKASPTDTDTFGQTLLHYACELVHCFDSYNPEVFWVYRQLLRSIIDTGVSPIETTSDGTTILDVLICQNQTPCCFREDFLEGVTDITMDLIEYGAAISEHAMWCDSGLLSSLRIFEKVGKRNCGREGFHLSEIVKAVCIKSEDQLCKALIEHRQHVNLQDRNGRTPLHLSVSWPAGVSLLIKANGDVNKPDRNGRLPLTYACKFKCLASVRLMVEAGSALQEDGIYGRTILYAAIDSRNSKILKTIIATLVHRRLRLQQLAEHSFTSTVLENLKLRQNAILDEQAAEVQNLLNNIGVPVEKALNVAPLRNSVYHESNLDYRAADKLFNAGFRDLDSVDSHGLTPLMKLFYHIFSGETTRMLKLGIWLTSKGADIRRKIPGHSASAGHLMGESISIHLFFKVFFVSSKSRQAIRQTCLDFLRHQDERCRAFLFEILKLDNADNCLCACSSRGCQVLTKVLKMLNGCIDKHWGKHYGGSYPADVKIWCLETLADFLIPKSEELSSLPLELIRFATFTRLGLTHTCCHKFDFRNKAMPLVPLDEVEEIRDEEHTMLDELDELVLGFESKYNDLGIPLGEFLRGYWSEQMAEVLSHETILDKDEACRVRQLGVRLEYNFP